MFEDIYQDLLTHLNFVLKRMPAQLPREMIYAAQHYQELMQSIEKYKERITQDNELSVSDYPELIQMKTKLGFSIAQMRASYHRTIKDCRNQKLRPSLALQGFPYVLQGLYSHIARIDNLSVLMKKSLSILEAEQREKEFKYFIESADNEIQKVRMTLSKTFDSEFNSVSVCVEDTLLKCSALVKHINLLVEKIGGRYAIRTQLDVVTLPEGLLWHPEKLTHLKPDDARACLVGLVMQYLKFFRVAQEHGYLKDFFMKHESGYCFEGSMSILSDWCEENDFLKDIPKASLSKIKTLEDFIVEHATLNDHELMANQEFEKLLENFCQEKYLDLGAHVENLDDASTLNALIHDIPDDNVLKPRFKLWVYRYCLKSLLVENVELLDKAWDEIGLTVPKNRTAIKI